MTFRRTASMALTYFNESAAKYEKPGKNLNELENIHWKEVMERAGGKTFENLLYAIDNQTSLFPDDWPWNMNQIKSKDSIIHRNLTEIHGVNTPYVNLGIFVRGQYGNFSFHHISHSIIVTI